MRRSLFLLHLSCLLDVFLVFALVGLPGDLRHSLPYRPMAPGPPIHDFKQPGVICDGAVVAVVNHRC